jgi:hypothetical protein
MQLKHMLYFLHLQAVFALLHSLLALNDVEIIYSPVGDLPQNCLLFLLLGVLLTEKAVFMHVRLKNYEAEHMNNHYTRYCSIQYCLI